MRTCSSRIIPPRKQSQLLNFITHNKTKISRRYSMRKDDKTKETYEKPTVEIVEFLIEESIAQSGNFGSATICNEDIYN
jgi:hypothetical protein